MKMQIMLIIMGFRGSEISCRHSKLCLITDRKDLI